jgi:hypothetical protein
MQGLTLQQIQQMGGKPVQPPVQSSGGLTLDQVKNMGGQPTEDTNMPSLNPITNIIDSAKSGLKQIGKGFQQTVEGSKSKSFLEGANQMGQGALNEASGAISTILSPISGAIATVAHIPVGDGETVGSRIQKNGIDPIADKISNFKPLQDFMQSNPNADEVAGNLINIGMTLAGGAKAPEIKGAVETGINTAKTGLSKVGELGQGADQALTDIQNHLSKGNVNENLGTSVDRLNTLSKTPEVTVEGNPQVNGATTNKNIKDPLQTYDDFYKQEQKFKTDAKEDTAIGQVGEKVGENYDKVINMRRSAGKRMSDEMAQVGDTKVDVSNSFAPLEEELNASGAIYNGKRIVTSNTSKLSSQDTKMLQSYVQDLNKLGANPTAGQLDAFLSRVPNELDVFKSKNNVTNITNGERIIKQNLRSLSQNLSPEVNPIFEKYAQAKADYASLSNFLDEGSSFLGKKTQSGDYAKDASIAKSSVQSILNGGKKDWLMKLESLTGYPAIDESMLALQAMKDAGNFRGSSLLDILSPKSLSIPTSKEGLLGTVVDKLGGYAKDKFVGSPYEQTRRLIQERLNTRINAPTPANTSNTIPSGGQNTQSNKININSMPKSVPPKGKNVKVYTVDDLK